MRSIVVAVFLSTLFVACQTCPDGDSSGSLFCHAGDCAADETICGGACSNVQTDRDNCGQCGMQCGDGMVCSLGACVEGCEDGRTNCAGTCVDTDIDPANCGACGPTGADHVCALEESCIDGVCGCAAGNVICGGVCTNPETSNQHCGATLDCEGVNTGTMCQANQGCVGGACVSRLIYRGSLPAGNGRWTYQGMLGLTGANAECELRFPGSQVCSYAKLLAASTRPVPETLNAMDTNGNAVASWWIDDPQALPTLRCQSNADAIPWSYGTADQGHVGKYVTLTPGTGAITELLTGTLPSCNGSRHVACCSTITAP